MTLWFLDRDRRRARGHMADDVADVVTPDTFAERIVHRTSSFFGGGQSRRSFLAKTAVIGSALALDPFGYILKPGTAYGALCGTCSDGWTAFCCTINSGRNSCPSGSFVAGWWKADNAAYCCGNARYILDCNATCPTRCSCRCSGASCDGRRTCCNQFRYGQCHQEIACYGPVVCRVATCTPPWIYDSSCTSTSATDNRTVTHGAPCLADECGTAIEKLYDQLGGSGGVLGPVRVSERSTADGSGRYAHYSNGSILQRNGGSPYEVHGSLAVHYADLQYHRGELRYPTSNQISLGDGRGGRYNQFDGGLIYAGPTGTHEVIGSIRSLHSAIGGVRSPIGYPTSGTLSSAGGFGRHQHFEDGSIWVSFATGTHWVYGPIRFRYLALGGASSPLGFPTTDHGGRNGGAVGRFQHGSIYHKGGIGVFALTGAIDGKYRGEIGETGGALGWPTSEVVEVGAGYRASFERGGIWYRPGRGIAEVHGVIDDKWRATGRTAGPLGWPITDTTTVADGVGRRSGFDHGAIYYRSGVGTWEVHGPIYTRYVQLGQTGGSLGYPRSDIYAEGELSRCNFQNGRLTYDPDTGDVTLD